MGEGQPDYIVPSGDRGGVPGGFSSADSVVVEAAGRGAEKDWRVLCVPPEFMTDSPIIEVGRLPPRGDSRVS
jgi:hypothetical protein